MCDRRRPGIDRELVSSGRFVGEFGRRLTRLGRGGGEDNEGHAVAYNTEIQGESRGPTRLPGEGCP